MLGYINKAVTAATKRTKEAIKKMEQDAYYEALADKYEDCPAGSPEYIEYSEPAVATSGSVAGGFNSHSLTGWL